MMRIPGSTLLAFVLSAANPTAAEEPTYMVRVSPSQRIRAVHTMETRCPKVTAEEWVIFASCAPDLPCQTDVSSALTPNGNSLRRVIGRVHYNGYFPRMDFGVPGDVIQTTPGHLFFSVNRGDWHPIETFQRGEYLRNEQGTSVPVEWISPMRWEFCDLYNVEVEEYHTYFVGGGPSGGIWSHNGLGMGCRVPRAAIAERESFSIASGYRINGLRETTMAQMQQAFRGTGLTPTRHFFERASELRTYNLGVRTYGDLQTIIRRGALVNADRGERALVHNGMAIVFDPNTGRLITLRPW